MQKFKILVFIVILVSIFLRIYKLNEYPPSLFADEVDLGYQAYSILKTGRDYYSNFLPIHLQSFADFRTPLYIYSVVPFIAVLGLNEWAIRIPAAAFGVLSVIGIYFLIIHLGFKKEIALIGMFLLAISPWHLHFSRAGFEVTLMLSFIIWGITFFIKGLKNFKFLFLSTVLLTLAPYTYSTAKLFTPIFIFLLLLLYKQEILSIKLKIRIILVITILVIWSPLLIDVVSGKGTYRFSYTSIFNDPTVGKEIDFQRFVDDRQESLVVGQQTSLVSKFSHNKLFTFSQTFFSNYFAAFSTQFLFLQGDPIKRHSIGSMGQFYLIEILTIILGFVILFKLKINKTAKLLTLWLLTAPIPASLTVEGGMHATRLFLLLPPLVILSSLGFSYIIRFRNKGLILIFLILLFLNFYNYLHKYYVHYPKEQERIWHYGFKLAIEKSQFYGDRFEKVLITNSGEPPLIFTLFWTEYDPYKFQTEKVDKVDIPGFGLNISKLGKYYLASFSEDTVKNKSWSDFINPSMLVISSRKDIPVDLTKDKIDGVKLLDSVNYPSGEVAFYLITADD